MLKKKLLKVKLYIILYYYPIMTSPYVKTSLFTTVGIQPSQMDNNIIKHIKDNLIKDVQGHNFSKYGYVAQIYTVYTQKDAYIIHEDPTASATFNVKFDCTLCYPLNKSVIVGTVKGIHELLIFITNGPIQIVVNTKSSINKDIFLFHNKHRVWMAKKEVNNLTTDVESEHTGTKYTVIKPGSHVKVRILNKKIIDKEDKILCIGYLEDIATDKEAAASISEEYNVTKEVNMDEYVDVDDLNLITHESEKEDEEIDQDDDNQKEIDI